MSEGIVDAKTSSKKTDGGKMGFVAPLASGAIGITADPPKRKTPITNKTVPNKKSLEDVVAIYSTKNVIWPGVGKVEKGYNIVSEQIAERWLTRNHIRMASPEEVAREYGK